MHDRNFGRNDEHSETSERLLCRAGSWFNLLCTARSGPAGVKAVPGERNRGGSGLVRIIASYRTSANARLTSGSEIYSGSLRR